MKSPKKGHNSQPKRSRQRGGDMAGEAAVASRSENNASVMADTGVASKPRMNGNSTASETDVATSTVRTEPTPNIAASASEQTTPMASLRPRAEEIVKGYVPLAVGAGMIPLPGVDLAAIGGLQLKVLSALAEHYRVPFTKSQAQLIVTSLLGSVGTTVLAGAALASVAKFVPVFGLLIATASMPVAGGVITRAMGHLAIDHFEAGGKMDTFDLDVAQQAFLAKIAEAKVALA